MRLGGICEGLRVFAVAAEAVESAVDVVVGILAPLEEDLVVFLTGPANLQCLLETICILHSEADFLSVRLL